MRGAAPPGPPAPLGLLGWGGPPAPLLSMVGRAQRRPEARLPSLLEGGAFPGSGRSGDVGAALGRGAGAGLGPGGAGAAAVGGGGGGRGAAAGDVKGAAGGAGRAGHPAATQRAHHGGAAGGGGDRRERGAAAGALAEVTSAPEHPPFTAPTPLPPRNLRRGVTVCTRHLPAVAHGPPAGRHYGADGAFPLPPPSTSAAAIMQRGPAEGAAAPLQPPAPLPPAKPPPPLFGGCWSCRLLSGAGLLVAAFWIYQGPRRSMKRGIPPSMAAIAQITFAISVGAWGVIILVDPVGKQLRKEP